VLVRDKGRKHVFVTREPDETWSRHEVSTFTGATSRSIPRTLAIHVAAGTIVAGGVVADAVVVATVVGVVVGGLCCYWVGSK